MIFKKNKPTKAKVDDGKALSDFMQQEIPQVRAVKKIIAVASAKGGVGKSSIACNLAIALAKSGKNIALVDADIYGPSVQHLMGFDGELEQKNNMVIPKISNGVKCMSIASIIPQDKAGVWRGPMVTKILQQLIRTVDWKCDGKEVDVMVIDMPPGTGDVYLSIAERFNLDSVILVTTPHKLAVIDLVKSIDCFEKLKIPITGIIENMSYFELNKVKHYIFGKNEAKKLAKDKNIELLGEIPILEEVKYDHEVFGNIIKKL